MLQLVILLILTDNQQIIIHHFIVATKQEFPLTWAQVEKVRRGKSLYKFLIKISFFL